MTSSDNTRLRRGAHGTIRVQKLESGAYRADAWYRDARGDRKRIRRSAATEAGAKRAIESYFYPHSLPDPRTVGELLTEWLSQHQGVQLSTREGYQSEIDRYLKPRLGNIKLDVCCR